MRLGEDDNVELKSVFTEVKTVDGEPEGTIAGFASWYNNRDSHDDLVLPGAFTDTLSEIKSSNRLVKMYYNHEQFYPGGQSKRPIGRWIEFDDQEQGLWCKAQLSAKACDEYLSDIRDGLINGFSIVYQVPPGGAVVGRKAGEPKRTLTKVNLHGIDLVADPSNDFARVASVKSSSGLIDPETAVKALAAAMRLHRASTAGGNSPTNDQRSEIFGHMANAHRALTGLHVPPDMKQVPRTIRELEEFFRDPLDGFGWSHGMARSVATSGFKSSEPRDEDDNKLATDTRASLKALSDALAGLSSLRS